LSAVQANQRQSELVRAKSHPVHLGKPSRYRVRTLILESLHHRRQTVKGWELLAVVIESFLPGPGLEPYLRKYFYDNLETQPPEGANVPPSEHSKVSIYASYCLRRFEVNFQGQMPPSLMNERDVKMEIVRRARTHYDRAPGCLCSSTNSDSIDGISVGAVHQDAVWWRVGQDLRDGRKESKVGR